jgi:integrase
MRYRLFQRGNGRFYCHDSVTGKQTSLLTTDRGQARRIVHAKNEAELQPLISRRIAQAYLMASDPAVRTRTWQDVMNAIVQLKKGSTQLRWMRAINDKAFDLIRHVRVFESTAQQFLQILTAGTVSTNVYLRRMHNFCLDMGWLPCPIVVKRQWPRVEYREKRAITWQEHVRIVERERNPERRAFYQLAWHLGASQSDLANLHAEDIDCDMKVISFERMKVRWRGQQPPQISFGPEVSRILSELPRTGPLFPYMRSVRACDRATDFKKRCRGLGIHGITLHSYRYAWAERAKQLGYPERYAQQALGHNSKAVHRAYAKKAKVVVPSLEAYEEAHRDGKIIPMNMQTAISAEANSTANCTG